MSSPTVVMTNPTLPGGETAITTQDAFDQVHEPKGWVLVDEIVPAKSKPAQAPKADSKTGA